MKYEDIDIISLERKLTDGKIFSIYIDLIENNATYSIENIENEINDIFVEFTKETRQNLIDFLKEINYLDWKINSLIFGEYQHPFTSYKSRHSEEFRYSSGDSVNPNHLANLYLFIIEELKIDIETDKLDNFYYTSDYNSLTDIHISLFDRENHLIDVMISFDLKKGIIEILNEDFDLVKPRISKNLRRSSINSYRKTLEKLDLFSWKILDHTKDEDLVNQGKFFINYYFDENEFKVVTDNKRFEKLHRATQDLLAHTFGSFHYIDE